jgi:hypothetical protein
MLVMKRNYRKTVSEEVYDEVYRDVERTRSRQIRNNLLWFFFGLPPRSAGDLRWLFWIGIVGRILVLGLFVYVMIYAYG